MTGHLFSKGHIHEYLSHRQQQLIQEIDALAPDTIINTDPASLTNYFIEKYTLITPTLQHQQITVEQAEIKIDISKDPNRRITDRSRPFYIPGTRVTYHLPYTGDADLFHFRPTLHNLGPPAAAIRDNELVFTYDDTQHDVASIKAAFNSDWQHVRSWLAWADEDVQKYNKPIPAIAHEQLAKRRDKLTKDQHLVQTLGYPLRQRPGAPRTYTEPTVRKKLTLPPRTPSAPAEPTLDAATYEHILGIIQSMALVLERSPAAFKDMKEEDLRTHFLVQLNAQYEGQATGETFNESGKTDILIRHENKNLFIAECKFWNGPTSLTAAIDQLLGYTSWRDTKTAILLFSKNKDFTNVLAQIPPTVTSHPNTIRQEPYASETGYRFTLHHQHDRDRHLTLTILAFNIPT